VSSLTRTTLRNPSIVGLLIAGVVVIGAFAYSELNQELIPDISFGALSVITPYPLAGPEDVERDVTIPVESVVRGRAGLETLTSVSSENVSVVVAQFAFGTDIERVAQEINTALARLRGVLPATASPAVSTFNVNDVAALRLAVTAPGSDLPNLEAALRATVIPALESLEGVARVDLAGAVPREVRVLLDAASAREVGASAERVAQLIQAALLGFPGGVVQENGRTVPIRVNALVDSPDDLAGLLVGLRPAGEQAGPAAAGFGAFPQPVVLGEIASVEVTDLPPATTFRLDGQPGLSIGILKTRESNLVRLSDDVRALLPELTAELGPGARIELLEDQARHVRASISELALQGGLGGILAVLIVFLFLQNGRTTLVTAVSIPLSLLIAGIALYLSGLSLNLLTLGGLAIAVGRVIDDSIVILENIYRHIQEGEPPVQAAMSATTEVGPAVAASTITSLAVFVPLAFVGGIAGEFFRPLGLAILYAIAASLLVAFTVVPVIAARALRTPPGETRAPGGGRIARLYRPTLHWVLDRPGMTILVALAVTVAGFATQGVFGKVNFFDSGPSDTLIASLTLPPGTTLERTQAAALPLEEAISTLPGIHTVSTTIGVSGFFGQFGSNVATANEATVRGYGDPAATPTALTELRARLGELQLQGTVTARLRAGGGPQGSTIDVVVEAVDPAVLAEANRLVLDALRPLDRLANVTSSLTDSRPTLSVTLDPRAAAVGVLPVTVAGALRELEGGRGAGSIEVAGRPVPIVVREFDQGLQDWAALAGFPIRAAALGTSAPLGALARIEEAPAPASITRTAGQRTAIVSGDIVGDDNAVAQQQVNEALAALTLPGGASKYVTGVVAEQAEAFGQLGMAIAISIFLVYTCMVAAFRSLLTPLLLLVAIPLAAVGAFPLLVLTGTPVGLSPLLGLLLLVGVVVTNAIVLIDLVERYRSQGMDARQALIEGGARRVRPILMTAVTTIVGLLPLALGLFGEGGGFISAPLAITVMGGLISSTFLTLVVLPALYLIVFGRSRPVRAALV